MSLGVSFHILSQHYVILLLKHLLALYKLIQIGVEIQSQLRVMVSVDSSNVADNVDFAGDIFDVLLCSSSTASGIPSQVNISLYNLFS